MKEWIKKTALTGLVVGSIFGLGYGCSRPTKISGQDMLYKYDMNKDGVLDIVSLTTDVPVLHKRWLIWYDGRNVVETRENEMIIYTAYSQGNPLWKEWIDCGDWCGAYDKAVNLP